MGCEEGAIWGVSQLSGLGDEWGVVPPTKKEDLGEAGGALCGEDTFCWDGELLQCSTHREISGGGCIVHSGERWAWDADLEAMPRRWEGATEGGATPQGGTVMVGRRPWCSISRIMSFLSLNYKIFLVEA